MMKERNMQLHIDDVLAPEVIKYREMWENKEYKKISPGLNFVDHFMEVM